MKTQGRGLVQVCLAFNILHGAYCDHLYAGRIVCRFEGKLSESHSNMRALGDHLRQQQSSGYQPFFARTKITSVTLIETRQVIIVPRVQLR